LNLTAHDVFSWPVATPGWTFTSDEIHLWSFALVPPQDGLDSFVSVLDPAERQRAQRFKFPADKIRFVVGRALVRHILGCYLDKHPAELAFAYGAKGKPYFAERRDGSKPLQFNLSHCENVALFAVALVRDIGVDLERVRPIEDVDQLVARFFSTREAQKFCNLHPADRPAAFFNLWTRKEAWLKAIGEGIGQALNQVEVSFLPGEPPRLLSLGSAAGDLADWTLVHLQPAVGFAGAAAFSGSPAKVVCRQWPSESRCFS
jgi:4'-phosphopantetheinyl transferase